MLFDKYAVDYPNRRLFSLNRSGFAGSQRYGIFPWSGDVGRNWSGLRAQLPVMLGMSMSGVPYVHADAGGFAMGEKDPELYVRWLQFAQFTPIFRPHGTALYEIDTQAISYPSEIALMDSPYLQLARNAAVIRYRMLPYNYTLSYLQTTEGQPLVSPLYYYFSNDTAAYRAGDEFMWGRAILVAPVVEKSATSRNVFLPKGNWYHYNTDSLMRGGGWHAEKVSLAGIPVFIREGSLIPLLPDNKNIRNTTEYTTSEISWHYYASDTAATAILFDDDGESKNSLSEKKYETITASVSFKKGKRTFVFKSNGGNFPGKPIQRTFHLVLHGMKVPLEISPHALGETATLNQGTSPEIAFPFTGKKVVIKVK
jgi:oligosaccharide 4-alpha-D-glucosyltransferase